MRLPSALRRAAAIAAALLLLLAGLFAWNGLDPSWRTPEVGAVPGTGLGAVLDAGAEPGRGRDELRVVAFNAAKLGAHRGGLAFAEPEEVRSRARRVGALMREVRADLVFLSEVFLECAPCPVNQVAELCAASGLARWVYGDNYRFGLPGLRLRSGSAVLSRFALEPRPVQDLEGGGHFFDPTGKRRLTWATARLGGAAVALGSVRNDSFDPENNARQARSIVASLPDGPVLLAGDFNAEPGSPSLAAFEASGRFAGAFDGPPTFPAPTITGQSPRRRIDFVLAPAGWELVEERLLDTGVSDHLAVLAVYRLP